MVNRLVTVEDVTFKYSGSDTPALNRVDLALTEGETVLVTGSSGAGKSSLCYLLNGIIPHFFTGTFKGCVTIVGKDTRNCSIAHLAHIVGLMFQDPSEQLVGATVEDEVAFGPENYGIPRDDLIERIDEAIRAVRLEQHRARNPHTLSGGQQQACALGGVLAMRPTILVLDEPTSNLDPLGSQFVLDIVAGLTKRENRTSIVVEHKLQEVLPLCDSVVVMDKGSAVFSGAPREIFTFSNVSRMLDIGINLPQVTVLFHKALSSGMNLLSNGRIPFTLEEARQVFTRLLKPSAQPKPHGYRARRRVRGAAHGKSVLAMEDLWHIYPGGIQALKGINLEIYENEFVAIIGQNGSGKTTLVKHFNGLLRPSKGCVFVRGEEALTRTIADLSRKVGYCFQNPDHQICCNSVREELRFGPKNLDVPEDEIERRVKEVSESLQLSGKLDHKPFSLSKGERQKLAVGSVLTMGPDVVIIDEPTTGQDFKMSRAIMDLARFLHSQGKTIIVITHDMDIVAEYVDRAIVLKDGEVLIDGPVEEVFSKPDVLETSSLRVPQITSLAQELAPLGFPADILTVDEFLEVLNELLQPETEFRRGVES